MKYIKRRDVFLKHQLYERFDMSGGGGSGPMNNDINWGDSLVGRLFNSIFRKVGVQMDVLNMNGVLKRVRKAFDDLLDESKLISSNIDKENIDYIKVSFQLEALTKAVHNGTKVSVLKDLTSEVIKTVFESNITDEDRNDLTAQLEAFLDFLDTIKEESTGDDLPSELTETTPDEITDDREKWGKNQVYAGMISILINLKGVLDNSRNVMSKRYKDEMDSKLDSNIDEIFNTIINKLDKELVHGIFLYKKDNVIYLRDRKVVLMQGENIIAYPMKRRPIVLVNNENNINTIVDAIIEDFNNMNIDRLTNQEIDYFNSNIVGKWIYLKDNYLSYEIGNISTDSKSFNANRRQRLYEGRVITERLNNTVNLNINKIISSKVLQDAEKSKEILLASGERVSILTESIVVDSDYASKALDRIKKSIEEMAKEINGISVNSSSLGYIISQKRVKVLAIKKLLRQVKEEYKNMGDSMFLYESVDIENDNTQKIIAKKIAKFAKTSMLLIGENMYGEYGEMGRYLERFNNDFTKLLNQDLDEVIAESLYYKINEDSTEKIKNKIIDWYDENVDYNKWTTTQDDVNRVDNDVEKSEPKSVNIDYIIEIVKLCNRAYKIHTKEVIPSGRSNGKVSNSVFREYEYMGSGGGGGGTMDEKGGVKPGMGPYRNKKAFNVFENGMLDIIKDRKYQKLFREDTTIKNSKGETKKGNGKILLKFITALIDDNKLYKGGGQQKFLSEYFDFQLPNDNKSINPPISGRVGDTKDNKNPKKKERNLSLKESISIIDKVRTFYSIKTSSNNIYMMLIKKDGDKLYFKYSSSISAFEKYIGDTIKRGDSVNDPIKTNSKIFFASIDIAAFPIKRGDSIDVKVIDIEKFNDGSYKVIDSKIVVDSILTIYDEDNSKQYTLDDSASTTTGSNNDSNKYTKLIDSL